MPCRKKINTFGTGRKKINDQWEKNLCQAVKKSTYDYKAIIVLNITNYKVYQQNVCQKLENRIYYIKEKNQCLVVKKSMPNRKKINAQQEKNLCLTGKKSMPSRKKIYA